MHLTTELVSRFQFAFTITFHILFPAFSIGLATFLAIMEGAWLKTQKPLYLRICRFWTKVFALTFGMGVVSGLVMEFQLGTNWSGFTHAVGPVLGALFTYEVLTAFFIEAGFLGVMIFGWDRVGKKLHYCATLLVCIGVTLSAFWILSANSWMQTPAGVVEQHGQFVVDSWWHVIFNPSVIPRYLHMMLAAYLSTSMVIVAVSAYYVLKKQHLDFAKKCFSFALWALSILIPIQMFMGDTVGLEVHQYQPLKTAAMEGVWNTQRGAPFLLFAVPDQDAQKNYFQIKIPHMAALINTHEWNGKLIGLKSVPRDDQPVVDVVFYSFRIMVGMGIIMLLIGVLSWYLRAKKQLYDKPWFLKSCIIAAPVGFIATITGWYTAECGRQPWVVYDILRTSQAASPVAVWHVILTFGLLILIYGVIFGYFYFRFLLHLLKQGPVEVKEHEKQPFAYLQQSHNPEELN